MKIITYDEAVDEIILKRMKQYTLNKYEETIEFNLTEEYFVGVTVGLLRGYQLTNPNPSENVIKEYNNYRLELLMKMRGE